MDDSYCEAIVAFDRALLFVSKQTTAYEVRISDWSSDVCSSDLLGVTHTSGTDDLLHRLLRAADGFGLGERPFPHLRAVGFAAFNRTLADFPAVAAARGVPLRGAFGMTEALALFAIRRNAEPPQRGAIGRASWRERGWQYG